ncbi:MAG TPA: Ig-like domain-containing protein [Candidatus Acidoferrales bacterium]|nr:Ig-like domain-containing protein [Candidatus Acidoferrales bacterium]
MRKITTWVACVAFLITGLIAGCGREQASRPASPIVVATSPANGAAGVPVAQVITATFNEAMNTTTINTSTFTVTGPSGVPVTGTVMYSGTTATFTPATPLASSAVYTATITAGAKDPAGNGLAANFAWTFTTGTPPVVISTNPLNGAINVPINQKVTATFSEAMNSATVMAAATFTVAVASGGAGVPGTVTYVAATNTATFAPTANLLPSTQYTATIHTSAQSAAGSALAGNYVWSFTTGKTADATPPTVIITIPASGATSVPTNQKINATFSKVMDPATITASGTFTVAAVGGAAVPGTVSYAGSIATFTPTANLAPNTQFTATITNAAKDLSGNALVSGAVPNPWSFTTGAGPDTASPTITLSNPANAQVNVLLNAAVSATFSKAMDPITITAPGTFTLAVSGVGGAAVTGNVTYDSASDIATFTAAANLTASTQYTATITNAAKDLAGNALAAGTQPNPWTFTTGVSTGPTGPNLGAASTFGSFGGGAGITNQGINTVINGDIGTTGASTLVTGFHDAGPGCTYTETGSNVGTVNGNIYTAPPPPTVGCPSEGTASTFAIATQAASDALAAFNDLSPSSRPGGTDPGAGQLGGLVLPPGTYKAAGGSFLITGSDLTLDGQGDANSIWVFQMASTLTVGAPGAPRSIILINGAQAKNVYWQVGSAATINAAGGGTMVGTIIASAGVTFSTAGNAAITTLDGRALGLNASVTMVNTMINVPAP